MLLAHEELHLVGVDGSAVEASQQVVVLRFFLVVDDHRLDLG